MRIEPGSIVKVISNDFLDGKHVGCMGKVRLCRRGTGGSKRGYYIDVIDFATGTIRDGLYFYESELELVENFPSIKSEKNS